MFINSVLIYLVSVDKVGIQTMYVVPLADSDYEPVATTVGRTVKINDIAGVGRRRATEEECAAR